MLFAPSTPTPFRTSCPERITMTRPIEDRPVRLRFPSFLLALFFVSSFAFAPAVAEEEARVAASDRYEAGRVHRFVLGGGYRDLWEAPIELPVLDLSEIGGGLTPTRRFGGLQTAVLGFKGEDGRAYSFRGTDKDPSAVLDPLLRDTIVQTIVQDQMAAQHPGGPLAAGVLTRAAGVLTVEETMVVMPNDPALGEFREEFAGMVGTFFVYPQAAKENREGFAGATEILDHEELYNALAEGSGLPVDRRAFLKARLMDILIGDFDRHRKQWRWARVPGEPDWQPIPEDRDQAFVRYDGVAQRVMKIYIPILQNYGPEYPFIKGLTLHGWEQDRWLLPALSWADWEPVVAEIQASLSADVIASAVDQLPAEYKSLDGARLSRDIAGRRDRLGEIARAYYEHLAGEVDVQLTHRAERVVVSHAPDGSALVEVEADGGTEPVFARRFDPEETREVRLYLRDGDDVVTVRGGTGDILVRVIPGAGMKRIDDTAGGATRVYDGTEFVQVALGDSTEIIREDYELPEPDAGFVDVEEVPPRDWGTDTIPFPTFGYGPDSGIVLGGQVTHTRYGFRKHPWSSKHTLGFGWAFEASAPHASYRGQWRPENSERIFELKLQYSGIEVLRFYGEGNETSETGNDRFFRARTEQARADFNFVMPLEDERFRVSTGPYLHYSRTARGARLIDGVGLARQPYGTYKFGVVGAQVNARFDSRKSTPTSSSNLELGLHDNPAAGYPTEGVLVDLTAYVNPPVWDVETTYGAIEGSISGYQSFGPDDRVTLAMRLGGHQTFGRTPFFDQAAIGGGSFFSGRARNRGFRSRRFQGDTAVYANTDLRVVVARAKIIVPGDIGLHGFFDVGRVFVHDENSDDWHPSGGGGVWFSPLVRTNTISLSVSNSPEETLFYMRLGFHY